jgi:hypothetical protein
LVSPSRGMEEYCIAANRSQRDKVNHE